LGRSFPAADNDNTNNTGNSTLDIVNFIRGSETVPLACCSAVGLSRNNIQYLALRDVNLHNVLKCRFGDTFSICREKRVDM